MTENTPENRSNLTPQAKFRDQIVNFEKGIKGIDGVQVGDNILCPLKHFFSDGLYVREIFIPKGTVLTGKIHKHAHPNFLVSGLVEIITEDGGKERLMGPQFIMSPAGTKRALHAATDVTWITVHHNPTNTEDLQELEEEIIAKSYEAYEKFIEPKVEQVEAVIKEKAGSFLRRIIHKIIGKI